MVRSYIYVHTTGASLCECYKGGSYPSVEHAFQAAKYDFTDALTGAKTTPKLPTKAVSK